jgi:zinc transport system ATP-binding protein
MCNSIVDVKDVTFAYNGETVLKDVNLTIRQQDFTAMIGPNGGGKTTLLKLILGLLNPDKGTVLVMGQSARKTSSCIGYVPQDVHTNRSFPITALDVVLMGKLDPGKRWTRSSAANRQEAMAASNRSIWPIMPTRKSVRSPADSGSAFSSPGPW